MDEVKIIEQGQIIYNQDRANIDSQVSTAKQYPRDIQKSVNNAIFTVTMDKDTASSCTYSVPRGGKPITGASVHLARILVQFWGNLRVETKVIDITDKHVISQATCWDIENNVAVKVEVRRSIMTKTGRMSEDMITVTGNAGNAIAYRNAVYSVIPKAVIDKVYRSAMGVLTGDISDETKLIKQRNKVVEGLKKAYGVTDEEILYAIGKSKLEYIGAEELVVLIGIGTAIKDGDTTIQDAFKHPEKKVPKKPTISNDEVVTAITDGLTLVQLESTYTLTEEQIKMFDNE